MLTGPDLDFGKIVVNSSGIAVSGPVKVSGNSSKSIAAIYITPACTVSIVHSDGKEVHPQKEKDQAGCTDPMISPDNLAAGWVVEYNGCCQSYPLPLKLVVYRPGAPLRRFQGYTAMWDWKFVDGHKQIAFYEDFPHGTPAQHYEWRDIISGRLLGEWRGDLTTAAPKWTRGLRDPNRGPE